MRFIMGVITSFALFYILKYLYNKFYQGKISINISYEELLNIQETIHDDFTSEDKDFLLELNENGFKAFHSYFEDKICILFYNELDDRELSFIRNYVKPIKEVCDGLEFLYNEYELIKLNSMSDKITRKDINNNCEIKIYEKYIYKEDRKENRIVLIFSYTDIEFIFEAESKDKLENMLEKI